MNGINWQSNKPASVVTAMGDAIQDPNMYAYSYDPKYQLAGATWGTPAYTGTPSFATATKFSEKNIAYDPNGNITGLQRSNNSGTTSDDFSKYTYQTGTNQLLTVGNAASPAGYATYTYNELGQLGSESQTGAPASHYLAYDVTGKITGVYSDVNHTTLQESYTYDESGNRIKTVNTNGTTYYVYDASGNVMAIYTSTTPVITELPVYGSDRLGTYTFSNSNYVYEMRDNVGSVRMVTNRTKNGSGQADVTTYNDYYPYGSIAQSGGTNYRYDYQGAYSEKDPVTGWNNFLLRMYDGKIGRWLSMYPAGQFASPYEGMGNNPVSGGDPTGGENEDWIWDPNTGKTVWDPTIIAGSNATGVKVEDLYGPGAVDITGRTLYTFDTNKWLYFGADGTTTEVHGMNLPLPTGASLQGRTGLDGSTNGLIQTHDLLENIAVVALTAGWGSEEMVANRTLSEISPNTLTHYTDEAGFNTIMESGELFPSIGTKNARYGAGQYLTDLKQADVTKYQAARRLWGIPWATNKLTHYVEIDITGLNVIQNALYNYLIPGEESLNLSGRIINSGSTVFKLGR